jgi:hypothetical protein
MENAVPSKGERMSESPSNQNANAVSGQEEAVAGDLKRTSEELHEVQEDDLLAYRVQLESPDEGSRLATSVRAGSIEEALVKGRDAGQWRPSSESGSDPRGLRVVEVTEESASGEALQQTKARRTYLNTIVETGLTALGKTFPERPDEEFFDVLCDFFARAVVWPGQYGFPAGDTEGERLLASDEASVLTQLLTTHLSHHGLKVARIILPE